MYCTPRELVSSFFLVFITSALAAQPTLTASNRPNTLDNFFIHEYDATNINPGPSGANVVWDFTAVSSTNFLTGSYDLPSILSGGASFPAANIAMDLSTEELYYDMGFSFSFIGSYKVGEVYNYNSNPWELVKFPITYGDVQNETFSGSVVDFQTITSRSGAITIEADAYGTLQLPFGDFNGVLRVKTTTQYADTWGGNSTSYIEELYSYYLPYVYTPILTLKTTTDIFGVLISTEGTFIDQSELHEEENQSLSYQMDIFPNPANEKLNILLNRKIFVNQASIHLINTMGIKVHSQEWQTGTREEEISVSKYPSGIYRLVLESEFGVLNQSIVIE